MNNSLIIIFLVCFSVNINAQLSKELHLRFIEENSKLDMDSILQFELIYFVRFDYCTSTENCGKNNFKNLLKQTEMSSTLFIIDTAAAKYELPSILLNKKIIYVDRERMMRNGLFSGHTVLIYSNRKKVKWLD